MIRWLMVLLVACERAESPPPPPTPVPVPLRVERVERTVPERDDVVMIIASPTEIWLGRSTVLRPITPATTDEDIAKSVHDTLATFDRNQQVIVKADKALGHARVVAILEGAKAAGFTKLALGTP